MIKNRTIDYIDNFGKPRKKLYINEPDRLWCKLSEGEKKRIEIINERYKPPKPGYKLENFLYILFIAPWIILLILAIVNC